MAEGFEASKRDQKLIFIDAYTDWCGWCKELDEKVYTDADLAENFNSSFINIKLDAEGEFGSILAEQMDISAFPTLIYLTPDAETFEKIEGFVPIETLQAYADQTLENWTFWPQLQLKESQGILEKAEFFQLISIREKMDENAATELANEYVSNLKPDDFRDIENFWLVGRYQNTLESVPFRYIKSHKDSIIAWHGETEYFDYMSNVYNDNLNLTIRYGDKELLDRIIAELLPELVGNDAMPRAIFTTRSIYYAQREEFEKYHIEVNTFLNNHLSREAQIPFILSTSYEVLENYPLDNNLRFLDQILNRGLENDRENFEITSLLGYVKGLQENFKMATELLDSAEKLATNDEEKDMVNSLREALEYISSGN